MQDMGFTGAIAELLLSVLDSPMVFEDFLLNCRAPHRVTRSWSRIASECDRQMRRHRLRGKAPGRKAWCALTVMAMHSELETALGEFRLTMGDWSALGPDELTRFFSRVPTLDVEMQLQGTERHPHGLDDNSAVSMLSVAVPHCHIVITDQYWASQVRARRLDRKYSTILLDDSAAVEAHL
jgi:hypothetical protein